MVCVTLEGLWMVSNRIVDFRFFVKFHRSGPGIFFCFWTLTEHVSYASKKLLIKQKSSSTRCVLPWKDYGWFITELSIFDFLSNFTGTCNNFLSFWTLWEHVSYASKKLLIKQKTSSTRYVLLWKDYGWFLIELSIFDFFVKFHRSGPAIIFSFLTHTEHVSYASKNLLIKQKTSSTWCVLL